MIKQTLLAAAAAAIFAGCGDSDNNDNGTDANLVTPFERVAVIDGTWDDVTTVANAIATYVEETDESAALGYPTNWIIAGDKEADGTPITTFVYSERVLGIPQDQSDGTIKKIQIVELCNSAYATQAMNTGKFHGPALPCEVSVHSDGSKIYVDMLNPEAIFTLFFADLSAEQKTALESVAATVKTEIRGMIAAGLEEGGQSFESSTQDLGPSYSTTATTGMAAEMSPYMVYNYKLSSGAELAATDPNTVAKKIIEKLGDETTPTQVAGVSYGASWRSGRPAPLPLPLGVKVIEACSPKYAKMATKLGADHATALPCEIAVMQDENDPTVLKISYLNPHFMFKVLFADVLDGLTTAEKLEYNNLPSVVFADLKLIVQAALDELAEEGTLDLSVTE